MKRYMKVFLLLYLAGFAAGILCADVLLKESGYQTSLLPVYLSTAFETKAYREEMFASLLMKRGSFYLAGVICGLTPLGVCVVIASLVWFGFLEGNLITLFLLEYGIKGMGIAAVCFIPQVFFYVPGRLFLFFFIAQMSRKSWGKAKKEKADYKAYAFFVSGAGICILLGIWMESYVNQNILYHFLKRWI